MFRKLKQKIEEGGSSMSPGPTNDSQSERSTPFGPGIASPIKSPGKCFSRPYDLYSLILEFFYCYLV